MKDIRKWAFVGLIGLASMACSSSSNNNATGGTTGSTGGTTTGTGGSHTGGTTGATGGSGGAGGATVGCASSAAPASAEIAAFSSSVDGGGITAMYGTYTYGDTPAPTFTVGATGAAVMDTVQLSTKNHYQGFGIYFNGNTDGTDCIDASQYAGIQFDVKGSLAGGDACTVQFSINDAEHADMTVPKSGTTVSFDAGVDGGFMPNDPKASGPKGAYAPQIQIGPMIMSATATIKVPFSGTGAPMGGLPTDTPIDTKRIEGIQWQLTTPLPADGGATECDLDMFISNIKFY